MLPSSRHPVRRPLSVGLALLGLVVAALTATAPGSVAAPAGSHPGGPVLAPDGHRPLSWRSPLPRREPSVTPRFAQYTLDVTVRYPAGTAPSRVLLIVVNTDDSRRYAQPLGLAGTEQRVSVPAGHYGVMAVASYFQLDRAGDVTAVTDRIGFALHRAVGPSGGTATIDLTGAKRGGIWPTYPTPPGAHLVGQNTYLYLGDHTHDTTGLSYEIARPVEDSTPYRALFTPVDGAAPGLLTADHTQYSSAGDAPSDVWNLTTAHRDALVLGEHVATPSRRFSTIRSTVYGDGGSNSTELDWEPHFPAYEPGEGSSYTLPGTRARLDHLLSGPGTRWEPHYELDTDDGALFGFGFARTFAAGRTYRPDFLRGPLAPGVASGTFVTPEQAASRTASRLAVGLAAFVDTDQRVPGLVAPTGGPDQDPAVLRTTIFRDGQSIATGTNHTQPVPLLIAGGEPLVTAVPASAHRYRVVGTLDPAATGYRLSTHAVSDYRFTSSATSGAAIAKDACGAPGTGPCTALPLLTLDVPLPTTTAGVLPVGRSRFVVCAGHVAGTPNRPITSLRFATSADGTHFTPATVVALGHGRYRVTLDNPARSAGRAVTTRIFAVDDHGSSLTQTVTAAYRVGSAS